jgi:ABC-type amino acid transport substrate-binding protein
MLGLFVSAHSYAQAIQKIRIPANESKLDIRHDYDHKLLELLLDKTKAEYGPYELVVSHPMTQFRALQSLMTGEHLDIMASAGTIQREKDLLAIRHSIHKSLLGIRLLLIKKERQAEFAKITSVDGLKRLLAGQASDVPDVEVLRANGFKVVAGSGYDGLFRMLQRKRFDYFPRSVGEIYPELEVHGDKGLVVEETIALVYPYPAYIYVNKKNTALAERLEKGWDIILKDGSFEKIFMEKHGESLQRANLSKRRIFYIDNPLNSDKTLDFSMLKEKTLPLKARASSQKTGPS